MNIDFAHIVAYVVGALAVSGITGFVASYFTVRTVVEKIGVHIEYQREDIKDIKQTAQRAHSRIDDHITQYHRKVSQG